MSKTSDGDGACRTGEPADQISVDVSRVRVAAYEVVTMAAIPAVALALARLGVFEALARAGEDALLTADEIIATRTTTSASRMPCDVAYLTRLLRMMAGKKILREVVVMSNDHEISNIVTERRFGLESLGRFLVESDAEQGSFLPLLQLVHSPEVLQSLDQLHESVLDPSVSPFERAHGVPAWEWFKRHSDRGLVVNKAMMGFSKATVPALLDAYRSSSGHGFNDVRVVVDVGGGVGASLGIITARYPHIRGINFDLPQVIAAAPQVPGVEHVSGNMFESVPSGGDAIFLKFILHSWDDERCLTILKNCYQALPAQYGKVIAVDNIVPEVIDFEGGDPLALQIDVHMMALNEPGGRERTERQLRELGLAAGFKHVKVVCKVDAMTVLEFHKT